MKYKAIPVIISILTLTNCLSLSMDIHLKQNGAGRIVMEYQIPAAAENLGRLDGNRNWPIIPVGRKDFERTIARIDGLKLVSYSSTEKNNEHITKVTLDFSNLEALAAFLDPLSATTQISNELNIILNDSISSQINTDLLDLLRQSSAGKKINISFTKDGSSSLLKVTDSKGNPITAPSQAEITESGRKTGFSINTADIFDYKDGLGLRIIF